MQKMVSFAFPVLFFLCIVSCSSIDSDAKKAVPERYKGGPISSIYVMQDEMTSLKQENSRQKEVLDKQQAEIESLKAMVNSLLATKG